MCTKRIIIGDVWEREVVRISVIGGLVVIDEDDTEDVSVSCDLVILEDVTGVTLRVWDVVVTWDSVLVDRLGVEDVWREESRILVYTWKSTCTTSKGAG